MWFFSCWANRQGHCCGQTHVLAVYFGTGIGAAYMADGDIFRGGGWGLELGHMPTHGEGRSLPGLRRDCLEVYASGRTLDAFAEEERFPVAGIFTAAKSRPGLKRKLDDLVRDQASPSRPRSRCCRPGSSCWVAASSA